MLSFLLKERQHNCTSIHAHQLNLSTYDRNTIKTQTKMACKNDIWYLTNDNQVHTQKKQVGEARRMNAT